MAQGLAPGPLRSRLLCSRPLHSPRRCFPNVPSSPLRRTLVLTVVTFSSLYLIFLHGMEYRHESPDIMYLEGMDGRHVTGFVHDRIPRAQVREYPRPGTQ